MDEDQLHLMAKALAAVSDRLITEANDCTPEGLAFADANADRLQNRWCECKPGEAEQVYFHRRKNGSHGWMCGRCRGLTQAG